MTRRKLALFPSEHQQEINNKVERLENLARDSSNNLKLGDWVFLCCESPFWRELQRLDPEEFNLPKTEFEFYRFSDRALSSMFEDGGDFEYLRETEIYQFDKAKFEEAVHKAKSHKPTFEAISRVASLVLKDADLLQLLNCFAVQKYVIRPNHHDNVSHLIRFASMRAEQMQNKYNLWIHDPISIYFGAPPTELLHWCGDVLTKQIPKPRGRGPKRKASLDARDALLSMMLVYLKSLGLTPTRNAASNSICGAVVISDLTRSQSRNRSLFPTALNLESVSDIWKNKKTQVYNFKEKRRGNKPR